MIGVTFDALALVKPTFDRGKFGDRERYDQALALNPEPKDRLKRILMNAWR
jgi:hypothetical protein